MPYRIKDWYSIFENNRSRELKRLDWVPVPNRMDGSGYIELLEHPNGAAHFGAWLAIVEIASREKIRGSLPQLPAGIPHSDAEIARLLSRKSRIPAAIFLEVIPRLVDLHIGWIEEAPLNQSLVVQSQDDARIPQDDARIPQDDATLRAHAGARLIEGKEGKEGKGKNETEPGPPTGFHKPGTAQFERWWVVWSETRGTHNRQPALDAWLAVVSGSNEAACFECTASYLSSLDDPSRGYNPQKFLTEQAKDGFSGRWPVAGKQGRSNGMPVTPTYVKCQKCGGIPCFCPERLNGSTANGKPSWIDTLPKRDIGDVDPL